LSSSSCPEYTQHNTSTKTWLRGAQIPYAKSPWPINCELTSPKICGYSVLNSLHITCLAPRILRWLRAFIGNLCTPEAQFHYNTSLLVPLNYPHVIRLGFLINTILCGLFAILRAKQSPPWKTRS
jgi:hypothetical protein